MILREYLYVDTTAVRGVLAQMDAGIVEEEAATTTKAKKSVGGVKGFAEHAQNWEDSRTTTKALGDAIFPLLEDALEAEGYLEDVSEIVNTPAGWAPGTFEGLLPPGKIVRITAPGYLIDARFVASVLGGFSVTHRGLVNMGIVPESADAVLPTRAKKTAKRYSELPGEADSLEGRIPLGDMRFDDDSSVSGEFLRGITQVARGMFAPGLHLMLTPDADEAGAITLRLQEGRQFLDSDTDVLFGRYGVGAQDWTVVGTIGHHPLPDPDMDNARFMDARGNIRRAEFGRYVNRLGTLLGNVGLTDLPQTPGFSVVPWAVYRTLGSPSGVGLASGESVEASESAHLT